MTKQEFIDSLLVTQNGLAEMRKYVSTMEIDHVMGLITTITTEAAKIEQ